VPRIPVYPPTVRLPKRKRDQLLELLRPLVGKLSVRKQIVEDVEHALGRFAKDEASGANDPFPVDQVLGELQRLHILTERLAEAFFVDGDDDQGPTVGSRQHTPGRGLSDETLRLMGLLGDSELRLLFSRPDEWSASQNAQRAIPTWRIMKEAEARVLYPPGNVLEMQDLISGLRFRLERARTHAEHLRPKRARRKDWAARALAYRLFEIWRDLVKKPMTRSSRSNSGPWFEFVAVAFSRANGSSGSGYARELASDFGDTDSPRS
jgi:hypothetical protein